MHRDFTFVDLFSGAGGFTEGVLLAGGAERRFRLLLASDVHQNAAHTHQNRFRKQLGLSYCFLTKDIRDRDFIDVVGMELGDDGDDLDLVVGGPPCQGFSLFGARDREDPRNDLFRPYLKVISALRPKYFVIENVPGLAAMYGGETVREIHRAVRNIRGVRYHLEGPIRVNAATFGVPQNRERILFIGSRAGLPIVDAVHGTHPNPVTASQAIDDLSFLRAWESNGAYHQGFPGTSTFQEDSRRGRLFSLYGLEREDLSLTNHDAANHSPEVIARFAMMQPGAGFESIPRRLWDTHLKSSKRWCVRLAADRPSYTVTTLPDDFVHYSQHRILTAREWARLQSFDDSFTFLGPRATGGGGRGNKKRTLELPQYTQIGNAVPPLLAQGIAATIRAALEYAEPTKEITANDLLQQVH